MPTVLKYAALVAGTALWALTSPAFAEPRVVATIKPIHSLVSGVMGQVGKPDLIWDGAASPHGAHMKPSQVQAIEQADVVFYISDTLETALKQQLAARRKAGTTIASLIETPGLTLLPVREGGVWLSDHGHSHGGDKDHKAEHEHGHDDEKDRKAEHEHGHDDEKDHKAEHEHGHGEEKEHAAGHEDEHGQDDHDEGAHDPHIWLDPQNAKAMVPYIAKVLAEADPINAETYRTNAASMIIQLNALGREIGDKLAPVRDQPFVVFHDAYQYFERRFDLTAVGAIALDPERTPGAKQLKAVRDEIAKRKAKCVFAEPQFEVKYIKTAAEGSGARSASLDPLGVELPVGKEAYASMLWSLASTMADCLSAGSE